jgi:outer membrane receptor protein involved in Fe transport
MNYQGTDVRLGIGTGLWRNVEVAHYHRPSDKLAFTVAGFYSGQKGFFNNANFSDKNDKMNEAGGKLRLIFQPNNKLKIDWTADYQYVNQNGFGYGELNLDNNDVADPATTIMNGYKRNMLNTGVSISTGVGGDLNDAPLMFTSTFSYQYLNDKMLMDQDYMTPDYLLLEQKQKMNALTQEYVLRSHGKTRWQHATGLYNSYQYLKTDAPVTFGDAITGPIGTAIANAMKAAMVKAGMPQATVDRMGVTMSAEMAVPETFRTPSMTFAAFHESNVLLNDRLKLTLGLRFNCDLQEISYDALAYMNMTGGTAGRQATYHLTSHVADSRSKTFTQLLPKVGLTYTIDDKLGNIYALVSKGYRAGGYNIQMFSDILQTELNAHQQDAMRGDYDVAHTIADYDVIEETIIYKPEESWNYEVGTHLNLFDNLLHFDLSLYYMQIRNQQLSQMIPGSNYGRMMVNAGKSHSCGMEATLRGRLLDNSIDWNVNYSFTNAKFDEYDNYKDKYVPFVPKHMVSAMLDYHLGSFTIGANMNAQGKMWWDEANTYAQKFYALLGAHADYDFGPVLVSLWGRNITDTRYNTFAVQSNAAGGTRYFAQRGNPIQLGMDVNIHL